VIAAARAVLADVDGPADGGRPDGPVPVVGGYDDDAAEAVAVSRWLRAMHRPGRPWSHLAVLARTNGRLEPVADALRRAGIPYRLGPAVRTGGELRAGITALRALPRDRRLRSGLADLSEGGLPAAIGALADEHALEDPNPTVGGFLAWLAATVGEASAAEFDPEADSVELSTFHRAKGLEWPAVALIGLEEGLVPISYAVSPAAKAEERRLLYVAVTRAEEQLWCSWAAQREAGGRSWSCGPSPMLAAIESAGTTSAPSPDAAVFAGQIASLRRLLPAAG
jgi:DNA helicase-2/ATP-dependent DNA helicase PcrA